MAYSGKFKPKNPEKYKGDPTNIIWRSRWECRVMSYFDTNPAIISWSSEEIVIQYRSPVDQKPRRYFPDFWVKYRDGTGKIKEAIIEVKPFHQTQEPAKKKINNRRYITEVQTYVVNQEKWRVADIYCKQRGWEFHVWTEKELNL